MRRTLTATLSIIVLTAMVGLSAAAAPGGRPSAAAVGSGRVDDVPPFVPARGADQPLAFAISGLRLGYAQVESGRRLFGVCWQGGQAPFDVTLRDANGAVLLHEKRVERDEVVRASAPVELAPGSYFIELADTAGARTEGKFEVVEPSLIPVKAAGTSPEARLEQAKALTDASAALSFEAYLRIVDDAVRAPKSAADELARKLCHRSAS